MAITALSALGPLRVWSLLVTVFGDLAPDRPLDGPTLSALMSGIGIKPEATRVALHRLRADGWITSQKQGRISQHSLTPKGRQDSIGARPRIYGRPGDENATARFALMPDTASELNPTKFTTIAPRIYICASDTPLPEHALSLIPQSLPNWIGAQIESKNLRAGYAALHDVLQTIDRNRDAIGTLNPQETAVLRVMIVHAWRRLALKHPVLPRSAHTSLWCGHDCRSLVTTLLDRYPRPDPEQLGAT
ncbi:PaaX family transcriptional regulator C-terminal domain-containing protein [uncultured Tateyamaria sp.]|uniref:PaaX family transcriptional regulator C-terminal domain-containing protein n=1 Tax=uncultured Tateyamaria sp. TaxID=455651 RepID=UPI0026024969|nr:PaaX family transcriptional regulator C-terminal domain-containing protein [uncultured Tateyamaria sp.]